MTENDRNKVIEEMNPDTRDFLKMLFGGMDDKIGDVNNKVNSVEKKVDAFITDHIIPMREEISGLKVKAGFWGVVGGAIPIVIVILLSLKWPLLAGIFSGAGVP